MQLLLALLAVGGVSASIIYRPGTSLDLSRTGGGLASRAVSPDNTCGSTGVGGSASQYTCPTNLPCCSINGYCGSTGAYCLTTAGCQTGFGTCKATSTDDTTSPDMTCGNSGAGTRGYKCPTESPCCSVNGWCGSTSDYCAASNCQTAFGTCTTPTTGTSPTTGSTVISRDGQCGGAFGTCPGNECCSIAGWCGTTSEYCAAPDCQTAFSTGCDANKTPSGASTSSIARPAVGSVLYGDAGIYSCNVAGTVAITYDDGPFIYTEHILDLFKQYGGVATFFVTGNNNGKGAIDDPALPWAATIKRMHAEKHQIASHTWSHADLCKISSAERKNEMYKNEMALRNILGFIPTYMRPPYSSCTAECGCEDDMKELGYHISYFDLDTSDYLNDSPTLIENSKNIFSSALNGQDPKLSDFLAIAHDIHEQTSTVLTEFMLKTLQAQGFRSVTMGECMGDPEANWYRTA